MSQLNKKSGNLRGVNLQYSIEEENNWTKPLPVQGWVIWNNNEYRFNIHFAMEEFHAEIRLTVDALINMLDAISEKQEPIPFPKKAGILHLDKNCCCTVDGCPCNNGG